MKTLKSSWSAPLREFLQNSRKPAFVGIGQELRGDDAAGVLLIRRLEKSLASAGDSGFETIPSAPPSTGGKAYTKKRVQASAPFLFEAGPLPEASAGPLRRYQPDYVVLIDAADMGEKAGTIRWLDPSQVECFPGSTHTIPLSGFAGYLTSELGCQVAILGIQTKNLEFDSPVSQEVRRAVDEIADFIKRNDRQ